MMRIRDGAAQKAGRFLQGFIAWESNMTFQHAASFQDFLFNAKSSLPKKSRRQTKNPLKTL
jgi:hypothetical protein